MANFRGRRVTDPTPILRAPPGGEFYHDSNKLSDLAQAWDSMGKAKSVLRRIEHRLEDAGRTSLSGLDGEGKETCILTEEKGKVKNENQNKGHLKQKDRLNMRKVSRLDDKFRDDYIYTRSRSPLSLLNYDHHGSHNELRPITSSLRIHDDHQRSLTPTKRVNFMDKPEYHEIDSRTRYHDSNSNMSGNNYGSVFGAFGGDDSVAEELPTETRPSLETDINFLNETPHLNPEFNLGLPSPGISHLQDYDTGLRPSTDFLRRTKTPSPYMLEGRTFDTYGASYTPGTRDDLDIITPGRRLKKGLKDFEKDSEGLARIKEMILEQRRNMSPREELVDDHDLTKKVRHQDTDPVQVHQYDAWEQPPSQPITRKIAAGPPTPSYKGFNEVETKVRTPEGRIVKVPSHRRKVTKGDRGKEKQKAKGAEKPKEVPTAMPEVQQVLDDIPVKENPPKKSARVLATKKPSKFERKDIITTTSWREGQKLIRRELGPLPKPSGVRKNQEERCSDEPMEDEEPREQAWLHIEEHATVEEEPPVEVKPRTVLSEEAREVLHDLALGSDDESMEEEGDRDASVEKTKKKHTVKRKAPRTEEPSKKEPIAKVRHYDSDEVRRYIQKRQNERKKQEDEQKRIQKEAKENRQRQLQDLCKRARSKVKTKPGLGDKEPRLDETFSKEPNAELLMRHPFHEDKPSKGTCGSDKENYDSKKVEVGQLWGKDDENDSDTLTEGSDQELTPRADRKDLKPFIPESEPMQLEDLMDKYTSSQNAPVTRNEPAKPGDTQENTQEIPAKETKLLPAIVSVASAANPPNASVVNPPNISLGQRPTTSVPREPAYTTGPYSSLYPEISHNRTKAQRLQALCNTAASLQNRLDAETQRLTTDPTIATRRIYLASYLHQYFNHGPLDQEFSPSKEAWSYTHPDESAKFVSRHDRIAGTHDDFTVFNRDLPGVGNLTERAQAVEGEQERNDAATMIQAAYRGHIVRQSMDWKLPSGSPLRSSLRKDVHLEPKALTSNLDRYGDSDLSESLDEPDSDYVNRRIGAALYSKDYCAANTERKRSPVEFTQVPTYRQLTSSKPRYMWEETRPDPFSIYNVYTRQLNQQSDRGQERRTSPSDFATREANLSRDKYRQDFDTSPRQDQISSSTLTSISSHDEKRPLDASRDKDETILSQPRTLSRQSHTASYDEDFTGGDSTLSISVTKSLSPPGAQGAAVGKSGSRKPAADSLDSELSSLMEDQPKVKRQATTRTTRVEAKVDHQADVRPLAQETNLRLQDNIRPPQLGRLSPASLERKLAAGLNRLEGMEESVRQLTDVERTRAVSLAQQETVALAQILKGRQQAHDRDMAALQLKARQETLEASQQLEHSRRNTADAEERTNLTAAKLRQEAATTLQQSTAKLLETQVAAAKTTAEAAKQLAEAKASILNHPPTLATDESVKMATEVASAAATAAVQAAMARGEKPPAKRTRQAPKKEVSEVITSVATTETRSMPAPYSTESFDTDTETKSSPSKRPITPEPVSDSVHTAVDESEEKTPKASSSIRTDPGADGDKTESISEDLASEKDYSFSFDETMTEDEIEEHSFRMVLPSEGHRRRAKIDGKVEKDVKKADDPLSVSSDDITLTNTNWSIDNLTGPFTHEDSFKKFTEAMVRQYMKEEEIRAQHQGALLKLREKALKEKTKAELEWLEQQKKHHREKGADDIYPQIKKKQRGLLMKLQQEQAEIKRLREASRAASKERQLLLYQQQEIQRLRKSAAQVRDKLKKGNYSTEDISISEVNTEDEISIAFDDHSEVRSPSPHTKDYKSDSEVHTENSQHERTRSRSPDAKLMRNIKKMKVEPKYLTTREKKLCQRRRQAEELLKWKKRLDKEEKEVFNLEVEALNVWDGPKGKAGDAESKKDGIDGSKATRPEVSESLVPATDTAKLHTAKDKPSPAAKAKLPERTESESSIVEEISNNWQQSASSIPEAISAQSKSVKFQEKPNQSGSESSVFDEGRSVSGSSSIAEEIPTVTSSKPRAQDSGDETLITNSVHEEYSNDTFVSGDTSTVPTKKSSLKSPVKTRVSRSLFPSDKSLTPRSPRSPRPAFHPKKKGSESESEDSFSYTQSETASVSDASDIEGRIRALNEELKRRKTEADRLKKEQKKRHKDRLKAQEASLKKQIEAYDNFISQVKSDIQKELELEPNKVSVKPQIKQPKFAEQKRKKETPVTTKSSTPEQRFQRSDSESSSNRSSIDESKGVSEVFSSLSTSQLTTPQDEFSKPSPRRAGALPPIHRKPRSLDGASESDVTPSKSSIVNEDSHSTPPTLREKEKSRKEQSQSEIVEEIPEDLTLSQKSEKSETSEYTPIKIEHLSPSQQSDTSDHVTSTFTTERTSAVSYSVSKKSEKSLTETAPSRTGETSYSEKSASAPKTDSVRSEAVPTAQDESLSAQSKNNLKLDLKLLPDIETKPEAEIRVPDSARTIDFVPDIPEEFSHHSIEQSVSAGKAGGDDDDRTDKILTARSQKSEFDLWEYVESQHDSLAKSRSEASKDGKVENDTVSIRSDKSSKSYISTRTYSDDYSDAFSDVSTDRRSEISVQDSRKEAALSDDDISEHLSYQSEFSEHSVAEPKSLHLSENKPELSLHIDQKEETDEDRTPVQSPASLTAPESIGTSTPKPEDPLSHINIGDTVLVDSQPGTLRFKGLVTFAPGFWAGIELDKSEGTNSGSKDGTKYFNCAPNRGIFAQPEKVSPYEPKSEHEEGPSDTSDHTITEEQVDEKIEEEQKPVFSPRSQIEDVSISSELERIITSASAAVEDFHEPEKSQAEQLVEVAPVEAKPVQTKPAKDMNKIVDSITDNLTAMVVKDSVSVMGEIMEKSPSKQAQEVAVMTPVVAGDAEVKVKDVPAQFVELEAKSVENEAADELRVDDVTDTATRNMLNDAISHMFTVRLKQRERSSESDGSDSGVPSEEFKDDRKSTPALSQTSTDTPESAIDNKFTPDDKILLEKRDTLAVKDDSSAPPVRPVSPVFGESAAKQLNHDEVSARLEALHLIDQELRDTDLLGLGDQEWFDDDFGLSAQGQIPDHPPPPYPGSPPQHPQAGVRHDITKLDLQRLTEEVFYAVPHKDKEIKSIISEVVDIFWEKRRYGEPLDDVEAPPEFLTKDGKGQDIEMNSRRVYKKLIFDLVAEHICEMYKEEEDTEPPPWAKSKRLSNKIYRGCSPPTTSDSLKDVLSERMMVLLGMKENPKESKLNRWTGRKKKDHVDEILVQELREEEPQWVNYDDDELAVKMQLTDAIFDWLLNETVTVFSQIQHKLDSRVE